MSESTQFGAEDESSSDRAFDDMTLQPMPSHEQASDDGEPALGNERFPPQQGEPVRVSLSEVSQSEIAQEVMHIAGPEPEPQVIWAPPVVRTPNFIDALLFLVLIIMGLLITTGALGVALHFHWLERWFGLKDFQAAATDTRIALGTQLFIYIVAIAGAVPLFQKVWYKPYFEGLHWHGATALRLRWRLVVTAVACNLLAFLGNTVLPFPQHAPIDKMFSNGRDAWMLASFGVLVAPFFEEMIFRGFLIPAMATAWDWCGERLTGSSPRPLDPQGNPQWSVAAMVFAALSVSVPFALMHSAQVGSAWGPVMLLYCVSLVLCAVRLTTRSLAASTFVHATYNFALFFVMFVETDGFRHFDKL